MESQKKTAEDASMAELDHAQLAEIRGGADWYCGTVPHLPPHLPLVAVQIQEFNGAIAAGSH